MSSRSKYPSKKVLVPAALIAAAVVTGLGITSIAAGQVANTSPKSLKMTNAGDIILVPTSGHTEAHISVVLETPDVKYFFAGDTSYNQDLMLRGKIDGVSANAKDAYETIQNIQQFTATEPTIYLPSHDPDSEKRLVNNDEVTVPTTLISDMRNLS
jgi:glyoxylase-like metal-dependent hydrolase (beta-lactamase superfamily II)